MPRLNEGIEASGRKGQRVQAKGVSRVSLGLGDLLTAGPDLRGIGGRRGKGADFTVAIDHSSPHALTGEQPAHPGSRTKRRADSGADSSRINRSDAESFLGRILETCSWNGEGRAIARRASYVEIKKEKSVACRAFRR